MQILTVLKSGGVYKPEHVDLLYNLCRFYARSWFGFLCLTDIDQSEFSPDVQVIPLVGGLAGWWSKLEVFREDLPDAQVRFYMDLDTIPVRPFPHLVNTDLPMTLLRDFNKDIPATGLMTWMPAKGEFGKVYEDGVEWVREKKIGVHNWKKKWDQHYIGPKIQDLGIPMAYFQDVFPGQVRSFKKECQEGVPEDTRIVCFHGRPRPWDVKTEWVVRARSVRRGKSDLSTGPRDHARSPGQPDRGQQQPRHVG